MSTNISMLFNLRLFTHVLGSWATCCGGRRKLLEHKEIVTPSNSMTPDHWSLMNWLRAREERSVGPPSLFPDLNLPASLPFTLFSSAYLAYPYLPCLPSPLGLSFHLRSSLLCSLEPLYHSSLPDSMALNPKFLKHSDTGILAWGWWKGCQFK